MHRAARRHGRGPALTLLLRDYKPYDDSALRVRRLGATVPNPEELRRMNAVVADILESSGVEEYFGARGGIHSAADYIADTIVRSGVTLRGRVLEFGAGIAKTSAVVSRLPAVEEVVANDFSEPLLTEVAPRVVSRLGGDLDKLTFLIGDMNSLHELDETFDFVVCYYAVHHLVVPEFFFRTLRRLLAPGGAVLCLREPAFPRFPVPTPAIKAARESLRTHRLDGENENRYSIAEYRRIASSDFRLRLIGVYTGTRFLSPLKSRLAAATAHVAYDIAYVLEKR